MERNRIQASSILTLAVFFLVALFMHQTNAQCATPCLTCSTALNCTTCQPNLVRVKGTKNNYFCQCTVIDQFYSLTTMTCGICSVAVPQCLTCKATLNGVQCAQCNPGFFPLTTTSCTACPTDCLTCQTAIKCTSCTLHHIIKSGLCVLDACSNLIAECLTCTAVPTLTCLTCNPTFFVDATGICITCSLNCTSCDITGCLVCEAGLFVDATKTCTVCTTNCLSCDITGCLSCSVGFFIDAAGTCAACGPNCRTCDATGCLTCVPEALLVAPTCELCSTLLLNPGCDRCTSTQCLRCNTAAGFTYDPLTSLCVAPASCQPDQALIGGSCQDCAVYYTPNCAQCDISLCLNCSAGFFYNTSTLMCDQICVPGEVSIAGGCPLCSLHYNPECATCDITSCITCSAGYFYNVTSVTCQANPINAVCGDGFWADTVEPCDDGNLLNLDGCDSKCQVELDYSCLLADKLGTGASFCKFTQNFTIISQY